VKDPFPKEIALWFAVILGIVGVTLFYAAVKPLFSGRFGTGLKLLLVLLSLLGLGTLATAFYVGSWGF
jgi:hypothetical protein